MIFKRRFRPKLIGIFILPVFILTGYLSYMRPDWLLTFGAFTKGLGWLTLIFLITPLGNISLGPRGSRISTVSWFIKLLLGQVGIFILFVAFLVAFLGAGPSYTMGNVTVESFWSVIDSYTKLYWGIFPWGLYLAWAIILGYFFYVKNTPPFVHCVVSPLFKGPFQSKVKGFIEGIIGGCNNTALSLMVVTIILLSAYTLQLKFGILHHFALPMVTMMVLSFVAMTLLHKSFKRLLRLLTSIRISLAQLSFGFGFIILSMLLISGTLSSWIIQKVPQTLEAAQCSACSKYFDSVTVDVRLAALYWAFWILFLPMGGSWLAKMSKGRTLRELTFGVMGVPFGWMIVTKLYPDINLLNLMHYFRKLPPQLICFVLVLLTTIIFWKMTSRVRHSGIIYAPFMDNCKIHSNRNRLDTPSKTTGLSRFGVQIMAGVIGMLLIHSVGGWYFIQFQLTAFGPLIMFLVYISVFIFIRQLIQDRANLKNPVSSIS